MKKLIILLIFSLISCVPFDGKLENCEDLTKYSGCEVVQISGGGDLFIKNNNTQSIDRLNTASKYFRYYKVGDTIKPCKE